MSVPPRWLDCPRKGKIIAGKFLPFKTPLGPRYDAEISDECRFDVSMLLAYITGMQQKMGLVIDLTKTDRFYDKRLFLQEDIGHYKLKCEGYGEAPNREQIDDFKRVCSHFFSSHQGELVGVHCTHGYNRTGYLIIAYLVEVEDWSLEDALTTFVKARPPGIYKDQYLKDLAERFNGGNMAEINIPKKPAWCFEENNPGNEEDNDNGVGGAVGRGPGRMGKKRGREFQKEHAKFVEGVSGVEVVASPLREDVQRQCQAILGWEGTGFPGSQPVSMDVQNIRFLHEKPYRVSWKADGTRYLMYIRCHGQVYMVDRDNSVFSVSHVSFPSRKKPGDWVSNTLVDGEMVMDKVEGGGVRPRYLIYDIMQYKADPGVAQCDHGRRLLCVQRELIEPREAAAHQGTLQKQREPFGIRAKIFWDVERTRFVLEKFMPQITHGNDGLIFSPLDPYQPGQCNELMKWKPVDINTVDFRLTIVDEKVAGMLPQKVGHLFVGGSKAPFGKLDLQHNKEARQYNGRIVECYWNQTNHNWSFMRLREDKSFPNSYTTATSVCKSIQQPVTKEWLLEVVEKHRWRPQTDHASSSSGKRPHPPDDSALMPPPKSRPHT